MHEELVKQKSGFQSRIQTRDEEISRLRSQVSTRLSESRFCVKLSFSFGNVLFWPSVL